MKFILPLCSLLLSLLVALLCYQGNPEFYNYTRDYRTIHNQPGTSPSVRYKELLSNCEAISQYRYDVQRQGVAPDSFRTRIKADVHTVKSPLNVGIHNASKASPIFDDTGIYIGSDTGHFLKLNFQGETLWSFYVPDSLNGFHGTAAIDDKKVYIGAYNGMMYALDKQTGEPVWINRVADYIGASPLLADGGLFISVETSNPDGFLAKLDCNTGQTLWVSQWFGGHSHSSPAFDPETKTVFVGANSGRFYAYNSQTGQQLWERQLKGPIKGTPMIWQDRVIFGSWDRNYYALNKTDGNTIWSQFMGGRIQTSLTLVPGESMGVTNTKMGEIIGLNLNDGEILWRLRHGDRNHQFSILVTKDEDKYLAWSRCKKTQLCILNAKTGKLLRNLELSGSFTSVPTSYEDSIYISLDKNDGLIKLQ